MKLETQALIVLGGIAALGAFGLYAWKKGAGIVTGDNALTRNATNAAGEPVKAYQGAGIVGTAGAAANAASGGTLASLGEWIGGTLYDLTHPAPAPTAAPTPTTGDFARMDRGGYADPAWSEIDFGNGKGW